MTRICSQQDIAQSEAALKADLKRKPRADSGYRLVQVTVVSTSATHLTLRAKNRTTQTQVQFVLEWDDPNLWPQCPSTFSPDVNTTKVGDSGELLIHHSFTDQGWLDLLGIGININGSIVPKWPKGS